LKFLDQLIQKKQIVKSYVQVGRPKAIHWQDEKLFLCVFYEVKKNNKRKNQFEVAIEIKRLFSIAFQYSVYSSYESEKEYQKEINLKMANLKLAIGIKDSTFNHYLIYKNHNYSGTYYNALYSLNKYLENATPKAIVQMRKRLTANNEFEWGLDYLKIMKNWK
jgi:hypothetical protein